jgi:lysophospholipase L1-like esterase
VAGDSTVQTYDVVHYPQAGWGQFLACGLKPGAVVINRAIGGRSTKSFIAEGRWDRLMAEIKPGDTVLIQFGHNDATKAKPERYADPRCSATICCASSGSRAGRGPTRCW